MGVSVGGTGVSVGGIGVSVEVGGTGVSVGCGVFEGCFVKVGLIVGVSVGFVLPVVEVGCGATVSVDWGIGVDDGGIGVWLE
jgi:hypothetical protein